MPECMIVMGGIWTDHEQMKDRGGVDIRGCTYMSDRENDDDLG